MRVFRNFPFSHADDDSDDVGVGDAGDNVSDVSDVVVVSDEQVKNNIRLASPRVHWSIHSAVGPFLHSSNGKKMLKLTLKIW